MNVVYRWDIMWGEARIVSRPNWYVEGYPPLPDESTSEYLDRLLSSSAFDWPFNPKPILYRCKWWQLWRPKK